jgi:hypothetical protein
MEKFFKKALTREQVLTATNRVFQIAIVEIISILKEIGSLTKPSVQEKIKKLVKDAEKVKKPDISRFNSLNEGILNYLCDLHFDFSRDCVSLIFDIDNMTQDPAIRKELDNLIALIDKKKYPHVNAVNILALELNVSANEYDYDPPVLL